MPREPFISGKRPLKPAVKPMTSTSISLAAADDGDLAFSLENRKSKGMVITQIIEFDLE
jgi:hypothetical protein